MTTTTVEVQGIFSAEAGKKLASIQAGGRYYKVKPEMLAVFQRGGKYEIEFAEKEFQGKPWYLVEKATLVGAPSSTGAAPQRNGAGGRYGPTDDVTAERIFVCGGFNALLSNPSFASNVVDAKVYIAIVKNLRQTWLETFGGKPSFATDLDDEIPI